MSHLHKDALSAIGNTPLVALQKIGADPGSRLLVKLESQNPTGSMKDRMALAMIEAAESIRGLGERLRELNERVQIVAVEPAESAVLSGGPTGAHKIDGVGAGFVVPLWHDGVADHIEPVSTEEAVAMAVRLAREEGLFAGTSTGANLVAALRLAERLEPGSTIVLVMCDTGMKYLSNASFQAHTSWR